MIAGPSSSRLEDYLLPPQRQLEAIGLKPHPISVDNYFVDRVNSPRDEQGATTQLQGPQVPGFRTVQQRLC